MIKMRMVIALCLVSASLVYAAEEGRYVNERYGFSIAAPKGWFRMNPQGDERFVVKFTKYQKEKRGVFNPAMIITADDVSVLPVTRPLDFANFIFQRIEEQYDVKESPKELEMSGLPCAALSVGMPLEMIATGEAFYGVNTLYFFLKDKTAITLSIIDRGDTHSENIPVFQEAVQSFRLEGVPGKTESGTQVQ